MSTHSNLTAPEDEQPYKGRTYVLVILFLVYSFSFIDRQILVILQESIQNTTKQ